MHVPSHTVRQASRRDFHRSPSLPNNPDETTKVSRLIKSDDEKNAKGSEGNDKKAQRSLSIGYVGFGAPHPKLCSSIKLDETSDDFSLLKDAERLIKTLLQDQNVTMSRETIHRAIQRCGTIQSKQRYISLLEKPWRATANSIHGDSEISESSTFEEKNPRSFRRSISFDAPSTTSQHQIKSPALHTTEKSYLLPPRPGIQDGKSKSTFNADDLDRSRNALAEANQQILSLQQKLNEYKEKEKEKMKLLSSPVKDEDIDNESLSSTNIDDNDEITETIIDGSSRRESIIERPLEYVRTSSLGQQSRRTSISDNVVSRLEYRALQIRNEQLLQTIKLYEDQITSTPETDDDNGSTTKTSSNLGVSLISTEQEKDIMINIVSRLNVADNEHVRQNKYMESKIATLVQQLNHSDSRCKQLIESESALNSKIKLLTKQLTECELKSKEFNESLMIQTEQRIEQITKTLQEMEKEKMAAKDEAARANMSRLSAESKYMQLEQMHEKTVVSFKTQLNLSESKGMRLESEVNKLMATSVELIELQTQLHTLQRKLLQSESLVSELRSNEAANVASAVADCEMATRRLTESENEVEMLTEELRESETTITGLMEEIESLKPLLSDMEEMERQLKVMQADFEQKEMELAESKEALTQSQNDVDELRNELYMLTSLPDIVRKLEKELHAANAKLGSQKTSRVPIADEDLLKAQALLNEKEVELLKCSQQISELQEVYCMAEDEIIELKKQLELLEPLVSDLECAERELENTCAKLDDAEQVIDELRNELDLLKSLSTDLDEAERELAETRSQLIVSNQRFEQYQAKVNDVHTPIVSSKSENGASNSSDNTDSKLMIENLQSQLASAEKQIVDLKSELEYTERKLAEIDGELRNSETYELKEKLRSEEEKVVQLQLKLMESSDSGSLLSNLREEVNQKNEEIELLRTKISEKEEQAAEHERIQSEMEVELRQRDQRIKTLAPLVDELRSEIQATASKSTQITLEYATIIPERDKLRKQALLTSSKISDLEKDIAHKNELIHELSSRHNDEAILESLQKEKERTLERCSDLSLQLAESQYKIAELTEQLRAFQRQSVHKSASITERRSLIGTDSFRPPKAFQSMINNGIDRISSRLDDSLRGTNNLMSQSNADYVAPSGSRFKPTTNATSNRSLFGS